MTSAITRISRACLNALVPILSRPHGRQVAALCYRQGCSEKEVLLITSNRKGRWIIPKGWPIDGLDFPRAALQEAWEEAGVRKGKITEKAVGNYGYRKRMPNGMRTPCLVDVFPIEVLETSPQFPEQAQRGQRWVTQNEAANMVREPALGDIIRAI